jgi:S-adenosyl-L-methionine hydrolase (adenosine-forming)
LGTAAEVYGIRCFAIAYIFLLQGELMIVLFTDFGSASPYQAQLHAALYLTGTNVPIIDLHADLACYQIRPAAYLLAAYVKQFPHGTVFVCIVDPGVGSNARQPVVVECAGRLFCGPDNGLFDVLAVHFACTAWEITWQAPSLSATFHGRDLFAPVAARLVAGARQDLRLLPDWPQRPAWDADWYKIVYHDHYGNLFTGVRAATIPPDARLKCNDHVLTRARTFSDVAPGQAFYYENAIGLLEIAVNQGSAAALLGAQVGTPFLFDCF